jgi:hypothetical protein
LLVDRIQVEQLPTFSRSCSSAEEGEQRQGLGREDKLVLVRFVSAADGLCEDDMQENTRREYFAEFFDLNYTNSVGEVRWRALKKMAHPEEFGETPLQEGYSKGVGREYQMVSMPRD